MPQWNHTFDVKDIWQARKADKITLAELTKGIHSRLKNLASNPKFETDLTLEDVVDSFEYLVEAGDEVDVEDFDIYWNDFYDWADANLVWVKIL